MENYPFSLNAQYLGFPHKIRVLCGVYIRAGVFSGSPFAVGSRVELEQTASSLTKAWQERAEMPLPFYGVAYSDTGEDAVYLLKITFTGFGTFVANLETGKWNLEFTRIILLDQVISGQVKRVAFQNVNTIPTALYVEYDPRAVQLFYRAEDMYVGMNSTGWFVA